MGKRKIVMLGLLALIFCAGCSKEKESPIHEIVKEFQYEVTDGTLVPVEEGDGMWGAEPFAVAPNSMTILTYSGNDGWKLNDTQQMGIDCDLEGFSEEVNGKFFTGNIKDGCQNSAIPVNDAHLGLSMSFGAEGEYYIYFMNTSSEDITVSNLELWLQDEGEMDKYIF